MIKIGGVYGRWTARERATRKRPDGDDIKGAQAYWRCDCACGGSGWVRATSLSSGRSQSCGCLQKAAAKQAVKQAHARNVILAERRKRAQALDPVAFGGDSTFLEIMRMPAMLGYEFREARAAMDVSKTAVSDWLDVSPSVIRTWESPAGARKRLPKKVGVLVRLLRLEFARGARARLVRGLRERGD